MDWPENTFEAMLERFKCAAVERALSYESGTATSAGIDAEDAARATIFSHVAQIEAERDAWRDNALACGKALMSFTPGGSGYFGKKIGKLESGGRFSIDPIACEKIIKSKMDALHQARVDRVLLQRERDTARADLAAALKREEGLREMLKAIEDLCSNEITARFGSHNTRSEYKDGRGSRVYSLLSVPRNIARSTLEPKGK